MKKFMVFYSATGSAAVQWENAGPEEHEKGMELWMEWAKSVVVLWLILGLP